MAQLLSYRQFISFSALIFLLILENQNGARAALTEPVNPDVLFYLYTPNNPDGPPTLLDLTNPNSLVNLGYDPTLPLTVLCHGFTQNYLSPPSPNMILRPAYFSCPATRNRNIVAIDWSSKSGNPNPTISGLSLDYPPAAAYTENVGQATATFLNFVVKNGHTPLEQIHLIGFSLGGPSMGFAARFYTQQYGGNKVNRVTAMDHAGPCFDPSKIIDGLQCSGFIPSLKAGDANFVDAVHTGASYYGTSQGVGDADFFMNGGYTQPGCGLDDIITRCSHRKSLFYYAESICQLNSFKSTCSVLDVLTVGCKLGGEENQMGENARTSPRGKFMVQTNENSPYSRST